MTFKSCQGCTRRHIGCHADCEAYKKEAAEWAKRKAAAEQGGESRTYVWEHIIQRERRERNGH